MEWLGFLAIILAWVFGPKLLAALGRAGWRAASGKGSFGGNFQASFVGMTSMEMRLRPERVTNNNFSYDVHRVEVKGLIPVDYSANVAIATAVFDITTLGADGKPTFLPVTCFLDNMQEPESTCYQQVADIGVVNSGTGFVDWVSVATLIPDTLTAPYSGRRRLKVFTTLYDTKNPPAIRHGFVDGNRFGSFGNVIDVELKNTGYREAIDNRRRSEELTLHAAISVAMADGALAQAEGQVIKNWVTRLLDMLDEDDKVERKKQLNAALSEAYKLAKSAKLDLGSVLAELARVGEQASKAEAVELCLEVMSADGAADQNELQQVNRIADKLGVDLARFQDMKAKHIAALSTNVTKAADYFALLGLDPKWSKEELRTQLNRLYTQWNSRSESLEDAEKRAHAELMLERIAEARKALLG